MSRGSAPGHCAGLRPADSRGRLCPHEWFLSREFFMNAVAASTPGTHILEWLAISLTPGLGPTKARKLVEHFGSAEAVFHASLTELEATGIQAVSAQSIATGKSAELAREEIARAATAGVTVVSVEDACYPPRRPASLWWARGTPHLTVRGWPSGWRATWRRRGW